MLIVLTHGYAQVNCPATNIGLEDYNYLVCNNQEIEGEELSGLTYNYQTGLFYAVGDEGTLVEFGNDAVAREITLTKNALGENPCPAENGIFNDTEGIVHLINDQFAIIEEREARIAFVNINYTTTHLAYPENFVQLQIDGENPPCENDVGLEGLTFNLFDSEMYTLRQSSPPTIYSFPFDYGNSDTLELTEIANLEDYTIDGDTIKSVHGIHFDLTNHHLLVIATIDDTVPDENDDPNNETFGEYKRVLVELTTCGDYVAHLDLEAQDYFAIDAVDNIEGITIQDGNIILIGEGLNNESESKRYCLSKYAPPCPIVVTEPITDKIFSPGEDITVSWAALGLENEVSISLIGETIVSFGTTINDGTEIINIPTAVEEGEYEIKITSVSDTNCFDISGKFQIYIPLVGDQLAIWAASELGCTLYGCTIDATTEYTQTPSTLTLTGTFVDINGSNDGIAYKDVEHVVHASTGSYNFDDIKGSPESSIDMAVDTRGFKDIKLRFEYRSEESKTLDMRYSLDGGETFIHFEDDYNIITGKAKIFTEIIFDFSGLAVMNHNPNVVFRIDGLNDNNVDQKSDNDDFKIVNMEVFGTIEDDVLYASCAGFENGIVLFNQVSTDDRDWLTRNNKTPSKKTGPTTAAVGSYFAYIEATGQGSPNKSHILESETINLSNYLYPALTFNYHMYGSSMGSLAINIIQADGTLTEVFYESGNKGDIWLDGYINLVPFAEEDITIQIVGTSGISWRSDLALDDICIEEIDPCTVIGGGDADGDGICALDDPDDNNACVPNLNDFDCTTCNVLYFEDFETAYPVWNDGGLWSKWEFYPARSASGNFSMRLNGWAETANTTLGWYLEDIMDIQINFKFYAYAMELGDDLLLQVAKNGSSEFETVARFVSGIDFNSYVFNEKSVHINGPFNGDTKFRFQLDGNQVNDWIYLDDIEIIACEFESGPTCSDGIKNGNEEFVDCGGYGCDPCPCTLDLPAEVCDLPYEPVCGCDNVSYYNLCVAQSEGGISNYTPGPCPSCSDGILNGQETSVDCGGPDCAPCNDACNPPTVYDFEYGLGGWVDGGANCALVYKNGYASEYSIQLSNGTGSSMVTSPLFSLYSEVTKLSFSFFTEYMESVDNFYLEISDDGGATWDIVRNFKPNIDFYNFQRNFVNLELYLSGDYKFRFRCNANANTDWVYIDNFSIQQCDLTFNPGGGKTEVASRSVTNANQEMHIYPNPVSSDQELIIIPAEVSDENLVQVFDTGGKLILQKQFNEKLKEIKLPLSGIQNGTYILKLTGTNRTELKKFIVME